MSLENVELKGVEAKDSRGRPTVEAILKIGELEVRGDVPAGASKGEDEAKTLPVSEALGVIEGEILDYLKNSGKSLENHEDLLALEKGLIERAGDNYARLGANAVLPVSRALWRAAACLQERELAAYIREHEHELSSNGRVFFLMNIFNGGLHALKEAEGEVLGQDRIDFQEIMVVPYSANTYSEALLMGDKIDAALKEILVGKFGASAVTRADEAGFSVKGLGDSFEAFDYVFQAIRDAGYEPGKDVKLALDVAASSFYHRDAQCYLFQGKKISSDEMANFLVSLVDKYPNTVISIEDGLDENDWDTWPKLTQELTKRDVITVGDDLFVTQLPRLEKGIELKAATAILIKVNQNGSVYGTLEVMKRARNAGMKCVVSHRSGETLDDSIADLAYATGAFGLKTGDPQPEVDFPDKSTWVRRIKYLRMIDLEAKVG